MRDDGGIVITDLRVYDGGRVQIPRPSRERNGIESGDWLDATVLKDHEKRIPLGEVRVTNRNRVQIRQELAEKHGLPGEYIDLIVSHTEEPEEPDEDD